MKNETFEQDFEPITLREVETDLHYLFNQLTEQGSDIIGIIDKRGNYLYVAENVQMILGYKAAFFKGKNAFDFIHPADAPILLEELKWVDEKKYHSFPPFRFMNCNGDWRWVETKLTNHLDNPAIGGLVVNSRDITEKKRAEENFRRLTVIAQQTKNGLITTNPDGKITWVNKSFEEITGYSYREARSKTIIGLLQECKADAAAVSVMKQRIESEGTFEGEISCISKKNQQLDIEIQCKPVLHDDGTYKELFLILTDITERKSLQAMLNKEVEQQQKGISKAVIMALEKERAELSKELHDNVNQILATVKLYLDMSRSATENRDMFIEKSVELLDHSIQEIRVVSRALAGHALSDISIREAVSDLVESLAIAGKIRFEFDTNLTPTMKFQDDVRLAVYRVAQEQFSNILKHAEATEVKVLLMLYRKKLTLEIRDNGKGFDINQQQKGMGLVNMFNRVEILNGDIELHSTPGNGTTLTVTIPATR